jgi:ribosomal protein S18 acetylase RimI-like enzyme
MIAIRDIRPDDRAWCARCWVDTYGPPGKHGSGSLLGSHLGYFGGLHVEHAVERRMAGLSVYRQTWNNLVTRLIERCLVRVAEDEAMLVGFVCWEPWDDGIAVHYVLVRESYQRQGVGRRLLAELPSGVTYYTHRTRSVANAPEGWQYTIAPLLCSGKREAA